MVLIDNSICQSSDLVLKRQTDNAVSKANRYPTIDNVDRLIRCRFVKLSPIMPSSEWMYALNMATAEPFGWEMTGAKTDKPARNKQQGPKENREVLYLTQGDCAWVY